MFIYNIITIYFL